MTAPDTPSPAADYWHGGIAIAGDLVLPAATTGTSRSGSVPSSWVYVTPVRSLALSYAATCNGWLYQVLPDGYLEKDPDSILEPGVSLRCPAARIIRRFKPSRREVAAYRSIVGGVHAALAAVAQERAES